MSENGGVDYAKLAAGVRQHIRFRENSVPRVPSVAELREWADAFEGLAADVRRMDWLDVHAHCADWDTGGRDVMRRVIRADDGEEFCADTWREAIDMALVTAIASHGGDDA